MSIKGEFREIVRIAGLDLRGENTIVEELARIKGIGMTLATALLKKLGIPLNKRVGLLSDEEISNIENALNN
ncbi:MAG: 30S ribosomal protein S13, partial [Candidatus Geothermarchaeota archaeon]